MKKKKRKLTPQEEKDVDYFVDRLANILIMQVEQEALTKKKAPKVDKKWQELTGINKRGLSTVQFSGPVTNKFESGILIDK